MTYPLAIVVRLTAAEVRSRPGPALAHYIFIIDLGRVFRWAANSALLDDGRTVIGASGGYPGAWLLMRANDAGADLADGDATLTVGGGAIRRIPVAALTGDTVLTFSTTNAEAGDEIEVARDDLSAHTVAMVNGGPAAGTLITLPVSAASFGIVRFDGTNWKRRHSALML